MKFKLCFAVITAALLTLSVSTGALPIGAAALLFVVSNACLADVKSHKGALYACPSYFDSIRIATEFLGDEIHTTPSPATPYYNFVNRGTFQKNTGVTHTTFLGGRVEPTSTTAGWSDVSLSNNVVTGGACVDSFLDVGVGFDEATFAPRKLQLKGPSICRDTLTYAHNPMAFIQGHYVPRLSNYVKRKIDLEFRAQVIKLGNKMSVRPGGFSSVFTGTTLPTIAPTSQLTWDWLDGVAARLIQDGATNSDGMTIELGPMGPVFPAFIGIEMLTKLMTNVSAIRDDFRNADMGKGSMAATLRAIGASQQHKNFRFAPVTNPPRYDFVGGILVEREQFEDVAATHGTKSTETSAYKNAAYEGVVIPHEQQYRADVVTPDSAGLDFDQTSWNGEWKFVTGGNQIVTGNVCYDPLHKWGAHFAEYVYAPEPIHTNFAWTLIYSRCQNDQSTASCSYGS